MPPTSTTVNDHTIRTVEEYRALRGDGHPIIYDKSVDAIDDHIRHFLSLSTFLVVSSIDGDGHMDVSPKGDPPGFVKVLNDKTLAVPERAGNRRADTFTNILQNPSVALICFVPGMDETMRINGKATLSTDPDLLASMEVRGHVPALAMLVHVEEAFIHCGKAPKRGRLWDPDAQIDRSTYPRMGEVMFDHGRHYDRYNIDREQMTQIAQHDYDENVYPS